ncbi:YqhA family protein [Paraferrimonas sedimenticola]|uniref:YqhA family protein n=1 Tax=Paraferrimonas sedimenticola TaxID=375674 RepID=UPI000BA90D54|nr:YqhA family protein [Paraferrimonas sedimenticola]
MKRIFESLLWSSRYSVVLGVISCLIAALVVFVAGLKDLLHMLHLIVDYTEIGTMSIRNELVLVVIEILDTFLLGAVLLIFAFGLYELFISNLKVANGSDSEGKILNISSIESLKTKLGKVILMMLIIKLFAYFSKIEPESALDLVYMSVSVVLVALALMLTKSRKKTS